ncbi:MAG: hypothetical protein B6I34_08520 [Anaerolineaceae bacterium 4572_32.1]|nr:MAG: hypothetical protein B6I34_08520 [Anaerolineaceae bacterium 4572_32.1]
MPESQLRLRTRFLPALVGLLLLFQLLIPYRGWRILLVGLGGVWLLGYLWARSLACGLRLTREMRFGWAQVGDRLVERFTLANEGRVPALWTEVVDHSTLPDYQASRAASVNRKRLIRWHREAICTRRGLFTLGPTSLQTGDPFGLYAVTQHYPASLPLMVLPPIVPLPTIEVAPGGRAGEGRPRANTFERTVSAASVREYVSGDSVRWIHWPTSARRDSLFVRLFDSTPASDWWILLDMNRFVQAGEGQDSTEEHGVILAASLADRGLRSGQAVGLVAHGERLVWLPPRESEGHRWEILRSLALVSLGERPLTELLARAGPDLGRRASLVVITPAVDSEWVASLLPLLRRGVIPTVLLLDPVSFGGTGDAREIAAQLSDLEVAHHIITRDLLNLPEAQPGREGQWTWRVLGTGRAVPIRRPQQVTWKVLS